MRSWLLVRRITDDPSDLLFYLAYRPQDTPVEELVRVCEVRWTVEECFAEAKAEIGLDQYEVRRGTPGTGTSSCASWPTPS